MEANLNWFWIIILLIVIGFSILEIVFQKQEIRDALTKKGAKNIRVSWIPFDFDRSNHTYLVDYEDAEGKFHSTTCKIHVCGSTIYWEDKS